jgi:uncharacterized protein (DUF433 family)
MLEYRPISFTLAEYPSPLRIDSAGVVRVGPTRVTLDTVIGTYNDGISPEGILERYSSLDLADIYATIAYYLGHRADVDRYLEEREREAERIRRELEARFPQRGLKERLLARRAAMRND